MQIEMIRDALTIVGRLSKGDTLNVNGAFAKTLMDAGVAKIREAQPETSSDEAPKKAKKAKKAKEA